MTERLSGVVIPTITPFDQDEAVSVEMMEHNFDRWGRTGVGGYMVLGSNGEFRSLDDAESAVVVGAAARLKGDKTLIVGVGRESLHQTLAFIDSLAPHHDAIDYLSVLTPSYFRGAMDGEALREYFTAVADRSPLPILLYVAPSFANQVTVPPSVVGTLADHPNIHGMKDTSPAGLVDYVLQAGGREDFVILAGSLGTTMANLGFGGRGAVISAANYLPEECAAVIEAYLAGGHPEAYERYLALQRLVKETAGPYGVAGLKHCMDLLGYRGGRPRLPVRPVGAADGEGVRARLLGRGDAPC